MFHVGIQANEKHVVSFVLTALLSCIVDELRLKKSGLQQKSLVVFDYLRLCHQISLKFGSGRI